jgi:hypothetical protein
MMDASDSIQVVEADASHDAPIRQLLRDSSMSGDICLSTRREPNYFASLARECSESHTIVATQAGKVVCAGSIGIRLRYLNGEPRRVAYLGQLRLANSHAGRYDILRRGFRAFHAMLSGTNVVACFTSIAIDNIRARRFLERGVRGLPVYRPMGELVTLVLPVKALCGSRRASSEMAAHIVNDAEFVRDAVNASNATYQLAPHWTMDDIKKHAAHGDATLLTDGHCTACLWDQRGFKQTVVTGYSRRLRLLRPMYNAFARVTGRVALPNVGGALSAAFVSHLVAPSTPGLRGLLGVMAQTAHSQGLDYLLVGFDARDVRCSQLDESFRPRRYRTMLYQLDWPDENLPSVVMDDRLLYPEIALL